MFNQRQHRALEPSVFGSDLGPGQNDEFYNPFEQQFNQQPPPKELIPAPEDYTGGSSFPLSEIIQPSSPQSANHFHSQFNDESDGNWQTGGHDGGGNWQQRQQRNQHQQPNQGRPDTSSADGGFGFGVSPVMTSLGKQTSLDSNSSGHQAWNRHEASEQAQRSNHMPPGGMMSLGDIEPPSPDMHGGKSRSLAEQAGHTFFGEGGQSAAAAAAPHSPGHDLRKMLGVEDSHSMSRPPRPPGGGWEEEFGMNVPSPAEHRLFGGGGGGRPGRSAPNQDFSPRTGPDFSRDQAPHLPQESPRRQALPAALDPSSMRQQTNPPSMSPIFQPTPKAAPDTVGEQLDEALERDEEEEEEDGDYEDYAGEGEDGYVDEEERHSPGLEARLRSMDQHHWQDAGPSTDTNAPDQRSNETSPNGTSSRFNTAAKPFDFARFGGSRDGGSGGGGGGGGGAGRGSGDGAVGEAGGAEDSLETKLADTEKRLRSMEHHVDAADGLVMRLRQKLEQTTKAYEQEQKLRIESEKREEQLKLTLTKLSARNKGDECWQSRTGDKGRWECSMCTLENSAAVSTCTACGHVRSASGSEEAQKTVLGAMWFQSENMKKLREPGQSSNEEQLQAASATHGRPSFGTDVSDGGTSSSAVQESDVSCVVCLDADRNATLIHGTTGHSVVCLPCAQQLLDAEQPCPICQTPIERVIENFSS